MQGLGMAAAGRREVRIRLNLRTQLLVSAWKGSWPELSLPVLVEVVVGSPAVAGSEFRTLGLCSGRLSRQRASGWVIASLLPARATPAAPPSLWLPLISVSPARRRAQSLSPGLKQT